MELLRTTKEFSATCPTVIYPFGFGVGVLTSECALGSPVAENFKCQRI
jgi:hypothetical protein